jgi:hypothetical protein
MTKHEKRERQREYGRRHYLANRARYAERAAQWRLEHPDRVRAMRKKYKQTRWGRRVERDAARRRREARA